MVNRNVPFRNLHIYVTYSSWVKSFLERMYYIYTLALEFEYSFNFYTLDRLFIL